MASRANLRRRKFVFDYLNVRTFYLTHNLGSRNYRFNMFHQSECFDVKKLDVNLGAKLDFSGLGYFSYGAKGISVFGPRNARFQLNTPLGVTLMSFLNGELSTKKRNEASAEECHQAVEGLSTAKAKAKAKRLQDSKKGAKSVLQRVWATILGIGPALRAVASMSRMERQQLTRTSADIFRLVPFSVFIIVPFMEFLLPFFLKLFPNMLPSTFQDKMKEEALKSKLHARIEYAKFLQDTVEEMAKEVQNSRSGEIKRTAEDLVEFFNRVRRGSGAPNEEIIGFAKLFNDDLTLDNISRPRLVNMCKYMGISPYGTDAYLRYMLRKRLQWIKKDDKLIPGEGMESLSEAELRQGCREQGMLGVLSVEEIRQQLQDWIDLSLNHRVPSSLLILSRAYIVSGKLNPEDAVRATLSSLLDEVVNTIIVTALPSEDPVSERRRKLEYLKMQEELIKEVEEKEREELERMKESKAGKAKEQARARSLEKREHFCEISRALAVLASASSVSCEREEFLGLVNKEIEFYNSMVERKHPDGEKDVIKAYRAAREGFDHSSEVSESDTVSSVLMEKVDAMLQSLDKEIDDVDAKMGDNLRLLDSDKGLLFNMKLWQIDVFSMTRPIDNLKSLVLFHELQNSRGCK
ncbi:hypothetical protein ES288_A09G249800v1 [Gossypium darwinii]|uniref:Letm1 RBD domain-containing protein n=1 Tax=Gossypium darwinii TaxID=34276 RepID=A0A5D2FER7_GOSDA|nr:hypothetical protein ES288_A09G249800v1 [Gossypium darwinii]